MYGGPGMAGFPRAQLSPPPMAVRDLPAPRKDTRSCQAPLVSGETAVQAVGNGGQPKAETEITQREKQEGSMK